MANTTNTTLYTDDMYLQEFEATVESVTDEKYIILDQTAFYPKSGGVAGDTGKIIRDSDGKEFSVIYTGKFQGNISHEVDGPGLKNGDKIKGKIDWERRYELMRYHTAAHVLSGVFYQEGGVKITGNDLSLGKGRVDFNFPDFDRTLVEDFVRKANETIEKNLSVEVTYITREELEKDTDLTKLVMGLPKNIKTVRIIDVGFDKQPDGGCHVHTLGEIGKIEIVSLKNKGKNNRRLYFVLKKSE
ncbi:MAG: alanyl-tRNA editing protein [Promethearchaeota archaeon]